MAEAFTTESGFAQRYAPLCKPVFLDLAREAIARGEDPDAQARTYAARGKPEFTLAYLLLGTLPEKERHTLYAEAHLQRATNTEQQAREWDRQFHRPFPLLQTQAAQDRTLARRIQHGQPIAPGAGRQLPLS